ncbi:MAG: 30S ribosomal protein S20 [Nitrospirota bacterium]
MANHVSALKRARQSVKRHERNKAALSAMKTEVKKVRAAFSENNAETIKTTLKSAISTLARTAAKGVIPKRRAARKISRLALHANKLAKA